MMPGHYRAPHSKGSLLGGGSRNDGIMGHLNNSAVIPVKVSSGTGTTTGPHHHRRGEINVENLARNENTASQLDVVRTGDSRLSLD